MVSMKNHKIAEEVPGTWKGKLGRLRQMSDAESRQKMIQYSDCRSI